MEDECVGDPFDDDIGDFDGQVVAYEAVDVFVRFETSSTNAWRE